MPLLSIESTHPPADNASFIAECSRRVAELLGKPESYVMVRYQLNPNMLFAGTDGPLALVQLKSLNLPEDETKALSAALCELITEYLSVHPERIYIDFVSPPRHMWGWNSRTF